MKLLKAISALFARNVARCTAHKVDVFIQSARAQRFASWLIFFVLPFHVCKAARHAPTVGSFSRPFFGKLAWLANCKT